jgi:hypothetical protein
MVAPAGAGPCPQITSVRLRLTSWTMIGTSPPGPFRCGSTTCSVKAVATPASKALPPFSSVAIPTAVAIQCVEVTTPKVPSISGRVVKGKPLGLVICAGVHHTLPGAPRRDLPPAKRPAGATALAGLSSVSAVAAQFHFARKNRGNSSAYGLKFSVFEKP